MRERFDLEALDPDDPFELDDGNIAHLAKHAPFAADDALDAWVFGDPLFYPAAEDGPADWLMVARVPGAIVVVPLVLCIVGLSLYPGLVTSRGSAAVDRSLAAVNPEPNPAPEATAATDGEQGWTAYAPVAEGSAP